jgi:hypothetical protein
VYVVQQRPLTWRSLLRQHGESYLHWIDDRNWANTALSRVANQLTNFLIMEVDRAKVEEPEAPIRFWNTIPAVRACCNDLSTYEDLIAVAAYAYVHFLERYRRTILALEYLTSCYALPLGTRGVRVLDVGTGPACSLYAVDDFYRALREWANEAGVEELAIPSPELHCIEQSQSMVWFFHRFSEYCGRPGPFRPEFDNFQGLNLSEMRAWHRSQNEYEEWWNSETEEYEEVYVGIDPAVEALFRYRLVIFSNFLTTNSQVSQLDGELGALFRELNAGSVVVILGGTGDNYQQIYDGIAQIARREGLRQSNWRTDSLGKYVEEAAEIIKQAQHRVYLHLESLVGSDALVKSRCFPDYWNPQPSPKTRPKFALRVFRRGRWPSPKRQRRDITTA